jgi:succinoglycan biosynthesis protein ExoA
VIPCRNEVSTIGAIIGFLLKRTGEDCEIIVADGKSDDGTKDLLDSIASREPRVIVINNPRMHTASGLNAAIRRASGEFIIRMDAHTRYADDYVEKSIETLEATGADNVGGPQLAESSKGYIEGAIAAACHSPAAVGGSRIHDPHFEGSTDSVIYGCWRRSIFARIGYFDEELIRNQDGEHNRRISRNGGTIWQTPMIRSWYRPRGRIISVAKQYAQYGYWKAREIQKSGRTESPRHIAPGLFVFAIISLIAGSFFSTLATASLVILTVLYILFTVSSAMHLCLKSGEWRYLPVIPLVFAAMQMGYGYGFLRGVIDFWIIRRSGRIDFMSLTR